MMKSVIIVIKKLSGNSRGLITALMIICLFASQYLNLYLGKSYFADIFSIKYMLVNAIYTFVVFMLAAYFIEEEIFSKEMMESAYFNDRVVTFSYTFITLCVLGIIYFK